MWPRPGNPSSDDLTPAPLVPMVVLSVAEGMSWAPVRHLATRSVGCSCGSVLVAASTLAAHTPGALPVVRDFLKTPSQEITTTNLAIRSTLRLPS
jgi:hypothetical protein